MPKFLATYGDVIPSRTPATRTKTIEAQDLSDAYREAAKDAEFAWGFQTLISVIPLEQ